ncbi:hypothetical protein D9611_001375 [Ephemerocybe angulata]|uniref:Uncharacterized protein n=1 Tax=Ephemerocybe angulata TaxID=980116 RepID=A0A8H5CHE0_9AGAR|nr:hypothetical protein D9611_001375 [Tulosesus angulatus]
MSRHIPNARFQLNNAVQKLYGDRGRLVSSVEHIPSVNVCGQVLYMVKLTLQVEYQDNFGACQRKPVGTGYDLRDDMASEKACINALYYLDKHYPKTITIVYADQ